MRYYFKWAPSVALFVVLLSECRGAILYVSATGTNPILPYASWATAATTIQDAIDASAAGDLVLVTNGVYSTGGKVMAGDLTNRVALTKAVTVQSVNGPFVTVIKGVGPANGTDGVRCAWLTNGAVLKGFTIRDGGVRNSGGPEVTLWGGVWCAAQSPVVANCIIATNTGGAAFRGSLYNCLVRSNASSLGVLFSNVLVNCTVVSNDSPGVNLGIATNCIVYFNNLLDLNGMVSVAYCCTRSSPAGPGNITGNPRLIFDGFHLRNDSPCIGAGTDVAIQMDIEGQVWSSPPPIGCDQWQPAPLALVQPSVQVSTDPVALSLTVSAIGQEPFACYWTREGIPIEDGTHYSFAHTTNLLVRDLVPSDTGSYQVLVSNAFGMATSPPVQVIGHYVNPLCTGPIAPYVTWGTAATNIQSAISAAVGGEIVFVTNGVYSRGGTVISGGLTNRIVIDKPIIVQSLNGPNVTVVEGAWDPQKDGPAAVRCAWLTNGAVISGFTLRSGATLETTAAMSEQVGAGIYATSTNATALNCVIIGNIAAGQGGGAYQLNLVGSTVASNTVFHNSAPGGSGGGVAFCSARGCRIIANNAAGNGGGAYSSDLKNCSLWKNRSSRDGGGAYLGTLINCTVTENGSTPFGIAYSGGGVSGANLTNCILYGNINPLNPSTSNYYQCNFSYSCTAPQAQGPGNVELDPLLIGDGAHLQPSSPCRGAGASAATVGQDIDGQSWANPPPMGCDEWYANPVIGTQPLPSVGSQPLALNFGNLIVAGQQPFAYFWQKDGAFVSDDSHYSGTTSANLTVRNFGPGDVGRYVCVVSNNYGMVTSAPVPVVVHCVAPSGSFPTPPYASWLNAATNIQDAIDVAAPNEFVLVTNGLYAKGGRVGNGNLTNRIAVLNPMTVASINGPAETVIQGARDPITTNGPMAVRCAWVANGAVLTGFTLQGGATLNTSFPAVDAAGGGLWTPSTNSTVVNCVVRSNTAYSSGGGVSGCFLKNCTVIGNQARDGGGLYQTFAQNTWITANRAPTGSGGGTSDSTLINCTVAGNFAVDQGGGVKGGAVINSIIFSNLVVTPGSAASNWAVSYPITMSYSCTEPLVAGIGNISSPPLLLNGNDLLSTSPCIRAGSPSYTAGTDIDGEPWANPPSMGCNEFWETNVTGHLSVAADSPPGSVAEARMALLRGTVIGRASRLLWSFGDGSFVTNVVTPLHAWTNPGSYNVTFTAFNANNASGVSTNVTMQVLPLALPQLQTPTFSNGVFRLSFAGQPGVGYTLEQTTNLIPPTTWQVVGSTLLATDTNVLQLTDPFATNDIRFYRVLLQ